MEKQFYKDDFEDLLKEQADRFTMEPTKRVWHSVYNNLHPSRKWPSIAISMLLLLSLFLLGYLNTSNTKSTNTAALIPPTDDNNSTKMATLATQDQSPANTSGIDQVQHSITNPVIQVTDPASVGTNPRSSYSVRSIPAPGPSASPETSKQTANRYRKITSPLVNGRNSNNNQPEVSPAVEPIPASPLDTRRLTAATESNNQQTDVTTTVQTRATDNIKTIETTIVSPEADALADMPGNNTPDNNITRPDNNAAATDKQVTRLALRPTLKDNKLITGSLTNEEKAWMEDYALYNKPRGNKWRERMSWTAYVTPSYSYRTLYVNSPSGNSGVLPSLLINPNNQNAGKNLEGSVDHKAAMGIEAGAGLVYSYSKRLRIKAGLQYNYTNYYTFVNEFDHPITTTLTFNNLNSGNLEVVARSSRLANSERGTNNNRLNNRSFQLSLPVGLDYKLKTFNNLSWYVGATLQPSLVVGGNSYLLSSDRSAYVDDKEQQKSIMRSFNLAVGLETFVSYKKGDYNFMMGPQVRYQLLTTNSKTFTVAEKVYNIGIKLGVMKNF